MEEAYSRTGLMTALWVAMSVSFCLPHAVVVNTFIICRGLCTELLWMCVLYVNFGSKVRHMQYPIFTRTNLIPAHFRCTQCSILLHLIDICFLPFICLWETCLRVVVEPGCVSTSPAFMRSSASHPAGPHCRLAQNGKSGPHCWWHEVSTQFAQQFAITNVTTPPLVGCVV